MTQILIVAATQAEIEPLLAHYNSETPFKVLITGVGMVVTAFALGNSREFAQCDIAINLGIAGSFDRDIALGDVVQVVDDRLSELGAENGDEFIPIETLGFGESNLKPVATDIEIGLRKVNAITVNTVHGNDASIAAINQRLKPQLESMEGAAFFYACRQMSVPCIQIRAVSNYVEKRNRDAWKIGLAVKNLNNFAIALVAQIMATSAD